MDIYPERYYLRPLPENKDWESLMAGAAGEYFLPRAPSANFPVAVWLHEMKFIPYPHAKDGFLFHVNWQSISSLYSVVNLLSHSLLHV